jgi:hypothetical protein
MIDYTTSLIWLTLWPIVIYIGYKLSISNIKEKEIK